jgi:hypothetical protein
MLSRRVVVRVAAGAALMMAGWACGLGAAPLAGALLSTPTLALNVPSGSGLGSTLTPTASTEFELLPGATQAAQPPVVPILPAPPPAIPESRRLTLEYPARIRAGDSDVIRMTLEVDTLGGAAPTAEVQGNQVTGGVVQLPNLYETHNVIAEADLDLAGVDFEPKAPVSEPLLPGESVTFRWSVHPTEAGTYRGTAWLFLIFTDKATGAQSRRAISAQPVQIQATTLFGFGGDAARIAGGLGAVGGGVLGFPFADDVFKWLWNRIRRRA